MVKKRQRSAKRKVNYHKGYPDGADETIDNNWLRKKRQADEAKERAKRKGE